jgi:hypothetical protein
MDCLTADEITQSMAESNELLDKLERDYRGLAKDVVYMRERAMAEHALDTLKRALSEHEHACAACSVAGPQVSSRSTRLRAFFRPIQRVFNGRLKHKKFSPTCAGGMSVDH